MTKEFDYKEKFTENVRMILKKMDAETRELCELSHQELCIPVKTAMRELESVKDSLTEENAEKIVEKLDRMEISLRMMVDDPKIDCKTDDDCASFFVMYDIAEEIGKLSNELYSNMVYKPTDDDLSIIMNIPAESGENLPDMIDQIDELRG